MEEDILDAADTLDLAAQVNVKYIEFKTTYEEKTTAYEECETELEEGAKAEADAELNEAGEDDETKAGLIEAAR